MKKIKINPLFLIIAIGILYVLSELFTLPFGINGYRKIIFSDFLNKVQENEIKAVEINGGNVYGELKNGEKFSTYITYMGDPAEIIKNLKTNGVEIKLSPISTRKAALVDFLLSWLPFIILLWFYSSRFKNFTGGDANPFSFSRSRAKLMQVKGKVTFNDVAGIDEAKEELGELVDFLKDPDKYTEIGAKIPRGCLLIGAPGTGKTLLAKAVAGEANVPFYFISGSDFVEMFVGVGASRVRDMFAEAKKNAPCLVFIDEIDAVGRNRGIGIGGGNDEREQTLNQLLVEMDGFEGNEGVIVIAATNRDDVLDRALLRPGRFDRQITVNLPDVKGREEILKVHARKVRMAPNVDLKSIAKSTPNFSGAELANIINEAGLLAARSNKKVITNEEIEEAKERVIMGVKNKNKVKLEEELKLAAYHEAGHALVALNCENSDPVYKATIIARGHAGGYVSRLPENDRNFTNMTRARLSDDIAISMGGRVAERLFFGEDKISAGAISDIKSATATAKNMVVSYGMNNRIGPVYCRDKLRNEDGYGFEASSNEMLQLIDEEIKKLLVTGEERATEIIGKNRDNLVLLAEALLKYETLSGAELKDILAGKEIRKNEDEDSGNGSGGDVSKLKTSLFLQVIEEGNGENAAADKGAATNKDIAGAEGKNDGDVKVEVEGMQG